MDSSVDAAFNFAATAAAGRWHRIFVRLLLLLLAAAAAVDAAALRASIVCCTFQHSTHGSKSELLSPHLFTLSACSGPHSNANPNTRTPSPPPSTNPPPNTPSPVLTCATAPAALRRGRRPSSRVSVAFTQTGVSLLSPPLQHPLTSRPSPLAGSSSPTSLVFRLFRTPHAASAAWAQLSAAATNMLRS